MNKIEIEVFGVEDPEKGGNILVELATKVPKLPAVKFKDSETVISICSNGLFYRSYANGSVMECDIPGFSKVELSLIEATKLVSYLEGLIEMANTANMADLLDEKFKINKNK